MVGFRLALPADNVAAMLERFGQHFSHQIQQQKMTDSHHPVLLHQV